MSEACISTCSKRRNILSLFKVIELQTKKIKKQPQEPHPETQLARDPASKMGKKETALARWTWWVPYLSNRHESVAKDVP